MTQVLLSAHMRTDTSTLWPATFNMARIGAQLNTGFTGRKSVWEIGLVMGLCGESKKIGE